MLRRCLLNKFVIRAIIMLTVFLALLMVLPDYTAAMRVQSADANTKIASVPAVNHEQNPRAAVPPADEPAPAPSPEAQNALIFIAQREGISVKDLLVANELRSEAPLHARSFQAVTVLDRVSGRSFQVLVDHSTQQVEDWTAVKAQQEQAYQAKYGKLQPDLYERLEQIQDTDVVTVTLFIVAEPGQTLADREEKAIQLLSAKYPEVRAAVGRGGKPMEVSDPVLSSKIEAEYRTLLTSGVDQQIQPLVQVLQAQGFAVSTSAGLPAVTVSIPKAVVLTLAQRGDVGTIFLVEAAMVSV
jgi:hypothetical protein